jgi:hypothetical protein
MFRMARQAAECRRIQHFEKLEVQVAAWNEHAGL